MPRRGASHAPARGSTVSARAAAMPPAIRRRRAGCRSWCRAAGVFQISKLLVFIFRDPPRNLPTRTSRGGGGGGGGFRILLKADSRIHRSAYSEWIHGFIDLLRETGFIMDSRFAFSLLSLTCRVDSRIHMMSHFFLKSAARAISLVGPSVRPYTQYRTSNTEYRISLSQAGRAREGQSSLVYSP